MSKSLDSKFETALAAYVVAITAAMDAYWERNGFSHSKPEIKVMVGRRYVRVVKIDNQRSVHSFVDITNGDILMAASWKAPAKHARGNVYELDSSSFNQFGAAYLR